MKISQKNISKLIEITPLNIKDDGSELNVFAGLRKDNRIGNKCLGHGSNKIESTFKIKDYLWAIRYTTVPSYETDCRDEISDTIRTVSKSLIALLFEEKTILKKKLQNLLVLSIQTIILMKDILGLEKIFA